MNLADIRAGIASALEGNGLRVYDTVPAKIEPPAAAIALAEGQASQDFDGAFEVAWAVVVLLTRTDDSRAQRALDDVLSTDGIHAWFDADQTLGGTVDYCRVVSWAQPGTYDYGGTSYVGVEVAVETLAG